MSGATGARRGPRVATLLAAALAAGTALGYTPAESSAGARTYAARCAECHGEDLRGGAVPAGLARAGARVPALAGRGRFPGLFTALQVFDYARTEMPLDAPGTLTTGDYLNVTVHLVDASGLGRPGAAAVTEEELGKIRVQPLQPPPSD